MARAVVEFLGGPDCGRERVIQLATPAVLPELLPASDGREQYHQPTGVDRTPPRAPKRGHYYEWHPEQAARRRPPCDKHTPPQPGCPGYQPKASTS